LLFFRFVLILFYKLKTNFCRSPFQHFRAGALTGFGSRPIGETPNGFSPLALGYSVNRIILAVTPLP